MPHSVLFSPFELGPIPVKNRMVMAPMTRTRATDERTPTALMAEYYAQRASAGLIITECVAVSPDSAGIVRAPGLYTDAHVEGWRVVVDAVHRAGGRIICQLWHGGRCSHASLQPRGEPPIAPSAVRADGLIWTPQGRVPYSDPRPLETSEIPAVVGAFAVATARARAAGFDGVELHAAFGYLPDQFLQDGANRRTDGYGGSVANRARFLFEVIDAMCDAWSADRVGAKLSPSNTSYGITDSNPLATFSHAISGLSDRRLLYLHLMRPDIGDLERKVAIEDVIGVFRSRFAGPVIGNGRYDMPSATAALSKGEIDLASFGRLFLANPDLPSRFAHQLPLNPPDHATFYGEGPKGYTDYPTAVLAG